MTSNDFEYETVDPVLGSVLFSIQDDVIVIRSMDGIFGKGSFSIVFCAKDQGWDDISSEDDLRDHAKRWLADVEDRAGIALAARGIVINRKVRQAEILIKRKMRGVKS
jgi:hypothetical protein